MQEGLLAEEGVRAERFVFSCGGKSEGRKGLAGAELCAAAEQGREKEGKDSLGLHNCEERYPKRFPDSRFILALSRASRRLLRS